ncbi:phosphonate degradation HD-domain oxygenase [Cupriavidus plantarum]|uniref:phosphonate degradation HD-domain oxygenase n=1 Tax=Cupriavidus plantarum TaxID=942865 RepID=UPI000E282BAA|nr:phosphonate degradation HD-domain oxygenase [Cupriavidus plantarum]REF02636.1 phosphonate degradation associated HDIG domain protein [Cupriavidus plantarum]
MPTPTPTLTLAQIETLFGNHGTNYYGDEAISQTAHALQCAQLAEQAGEPEALIVAALLHDVGHLMLAESSTTDMRHQEAAAGALAALFDDAVTEPVRLHVAAKRYLCARDAGYHDTLSPASVHSLVLQGGPFDEAKADAFAQQPHALAAVRLRRYDDLAKVVGLETPPLSHYMAMAARCTRANAAA